MLPIEHYMSETARVTFGLCFYINSFAKSGCKYSCFTKCTITFTPSFHINLWTVYKGIHPQNAHILIMYTDEIFSAITPVNMPDPIRILSGSAGKHWPEKSPKPNLKSNVLLRLERWLSTDTHSSELEPTFDFSHV